MPGDRDLDARIRAAAPTAQRPLDAAGLWQRGRRRRTVMLTAAGGAVIAAVAVAVALTAPVMQPSQLSVSEQPPGEMPDDAEQPGDDGSSVDDLELAACPDPAGLVEAPSRPEDRLHDLLAGSDTLTDVADGGGRYEIQAKRVEEATVQRWLAERCHGATADSAWSVVACPAGSDQCHEAGDPSVRWLVVPVDDGWQTVALAPAHLDDPLAGADPAETEEPSCPPSDDRPEGPAVWFVCAGELPFGGAQPDVSGMAPVAADEDGDPVALVEALADGPPGGADPPMDAWSGAEHLREVSVEDGTVTLDLDRDAQLHPSGLLAGLVTPVQATLATIDGVAELRITLEGSCAAARRSGELSTCRFEVGEAWRDEVHRPSR
ncbi:MAG: GerMN domain-containing protein [Nitriliruptoraceae bacterium]